nr:energy transducer TonB [Vibrio cholerae]
EPLTTLPDGLTEEAVRAVQKIKFLPAMVDGQPVSVVKLLEYHFEIY